MLLRFLHVEGNNFLQTFFTLSQTLLTLFISFHYHGNYFVSPCWKMRLTFWVQYDFIQSLLTININYLLVNCNSVEPPLDIYIGSSLEYLVELIHQPSLNTYNLLLLPLRYHYIYGSNFEFSL